MFYRLLADLILVFHFAFVLWVIVGQVLILVGLLAGWRWVRHFWFRMAHLASIGVVVVQAWCGVICPLTIWENELRHAAGEAEYPGAFVAYWVSEALFHEAEPWVFTLGYTIFAATVLAAFIFGPPRRKTKPRRRELATDGHG